MHLILVVGNPKSASRTRRAGELLAQRLTGQPPAQVIEVSELGAGLLGWGDPQVAAAKASVASADLLIVASPTFKASYTGLLKLFLDQFGADELKGMPTVAVMLGAAPQHALAPEHLLKPVLVEIGCSCPTPALYLLDSAYESAAEIDLWLERARRSLPARLVAQQ